MGTVPAAEGSHRYYLSFVKSFQYLFTLHPLGDCPSSSFPDVCLVSHDSCPPLARASHCCSCPGLGLSCTSCSKVVAARGLMARHAVAASVLMASLPSLSSPL